MTGSLIVNNLAGLMMITSLLVIGVKRPIASCWLYALQSLVLVLIFVTLGQTLGAHQLSMWAVSAFITKVVLVPVIMGYAFRRMADPSADGSLIGPVGLMIAAAVIVVLCGFVVEPVNVPLVATLKPALAVSLGHFLLGLLCIVTQRNILKQVFGYCLMENGSHLTLALLANRAPELVEIGIATDAIFAVIVMAVLARKIYRTLNTLSVEQLTALKG
ncbi:hydrogenase 4 membrane subunit [Enterobacillus tribolii]|uniref:Hydrogenase-4 component E n=1 Tax=Enterobacillus tribolii TaxID=1487935 RepID=A0A370Q4I5_9GAMM|nr:hydrogenase 4 membrane subunit [Enterobacillus tribolii]MBW7985060.1 hydrogenase 4 membrane subunit [Enterobacillus tribolii]RDK83288.1 hydrogenase-4 component E [Enterobacillus tribolii]